MGPSVAQIGWRTENRVMKLPSSLCHRRGQSQLNLAYLLPCFYTASSSWATDAIDIASAELDGQRAINLRPSSGRRNNLILTTMTSTEAEEAGEAFALFLGALSSTETSFWFRILDQENDASSDDNQERLLTKHGEENVIHWHHYFHFHCTHRR